MAGPTIISTSGALPKFEKSSSQTNRNKFNVGTNTLNSTQGLSEADKSALATKRLELETLTKKLDKFSTGKSADDFKKERTDASDNLEKYRTQVLDQKNSTDENIQKRTAIDKGVKGLGSIVAGLVGNATGQSVGDKYKYDSYDPQTDTRDAEFLAKQNDDVLGTKYKTAISESSAQQAAEQESLKMQIKAKVEEMEAIRKAATKQKDETGFNTGRSEEDASTLADIDRDENGKGKGGGGSGVKLDSANITPANTKNLEAAALNDERTTNAAGLTDKQRKEKFLSSIKSNFKGSIYYLQQMDADGGTIPYEDYGLFLSDPTTFGIKYPQFAAQAEAQLNILTGTLFDKGTGKTTPLKNSAPPTLPQNDDDGGEGEGEIPTTVATPEVQVKPKLKQKPSSNAPAKGLDKYKGVLPGEKTFKMKSQQFRYAESLTPGVFTVIGPDNNRMTFDKQEMDNLLLQQDKPK